MNDIAIRQNAIIEQNLINIYHNSPNIESLCKVLLYDFNLDRVVITWQISTDVSYVYLANKSNDIDKSSDTSNDKINKSNDKINKSSDKINDKINTSNDKSNDTSNDKINNTTNKYLYQEINLEYIMATYDLHYHTEFKQCKIYHDKDIKPSSIYLFILETFINKLIHEDTLLRHKHKQEIIINSITRSIKEPLSNILSATKTLTVRDSSADSTISQLNHSIVLLTNNIFDIVDILQLEINTLKITYNIFNLYDLIYQVILVARTYVKGNVLFEYFIDNSVPENIYSDQKRIKQILLNLLENALQYTDHGEVVLYISAELINLRNEEPTEYVPDINQYHISFIIRDTGIGMSKSVVETLFKPLEISQSTGVGLRLSYLLAKYLNGILRLTFSEPCKGSIFQLDLIVCEEEEPIISSNTLKTLKGKKVLLLIKSNKEIICKLLEKYKMKYIISSTHEEIIILYNDKIFDLIITDDSRIVNKYNSPLIILDNENDEINELEFKKILIDSQKG